MTPKESAKVIFGVLHDDWFSWTPEVVEAFNMAISALEKQIPEKPKPMLGIYGKKQLECGNCGGDVEEISSYCPWCGQALG